MVQLKTLATHTPSMIENMLPSFAQQVFREGKEGK